MKKINFTLLFALTFLFFRVSFAQTEDTLDHDNPELKFEDDFNKTKDPALGYPPYERLRPIREALRNSSLHASSSLQCANWEERGPSNVGGRTRAFMYDPNDVTGKKVWAGSVSGGLWYNNDITNAALGWIKVNDFWDDIAISSIAYNPLNPLEFYVTTGEGWSNADAHIGDGIRKSIDGGITWNLLSSTTGANFYYIQKIIIHPTTGDIYIATKTNGVMRSQNAGVSWTKVLGTAAGATFNTAADLELGADNTIYASIGIANTDGIYSSTTGALGSWTKLNTGINGFPTTGFNRIEFATAPSNANVIYALANQSTMPNIYITTNKGLTWTTVTQPYDSYLSLTDYTRGQGWYDLSIGVDPNNENTLFIGGINIFKSSNAGASWTQISGSTQYPLVPIIGPYSDVHVDQHGVIFKPSSSSEVVFINDGGVFFSSNGTASLPTVTSRRKDYNVTQFYSCAIDPTAGSNKFLAGSQDNGTLWFSNPGINNAVTVYDGDGIFCAIDQVNPNVQIANALGSNYTRSLTGGGSPFAFTGFSAGPVLMNIVPTDYDDIGKSMYFDCGLNQIRFVNNLNATISFGQFTIPSIALASVIKVSPFTPFTTFLAGSGPAIARVTNANTTAPTITAINPPPVSSGASPSSIDLGVDELHMLITYSNFGVFSVWETEDGGINWKNLDINTSSSGLPDMPVWWGLYNPNDRKEVILATELGIWSCDDVSIVSPTWQAINTGLANVRVKQLKTRSSDNLVIAATYGRGLFSSNLFLHPVANFTYSSASPCFYAGATINFTDASTLTPTSWMWDFGDGGTSTLQNPSYVYSVAGTYTVTLTATNANGCGTTMQQIIIISTSALAPDLYVTDSPDDVGNEPDAETMASMGVNFWSSDGVWIRQINDGFTNQFSEPIEYMAGTPNYIYVRVKNRGCSSQTGDLRVYWASAGTGLGWSADWVNNTATYSTCTATIYGDEIIPSTSVTIASLSEQIYEIPWQPNDPDTYGCFIDPFHFCLLARIETSSTPPYGMTAPEGTSVWSNTVDNNNIAWKNIIINNAIAGLNKPFGTTIIRNTDQTAKFISLNFVSRKDDIGQDLSQFKRIRLYFTSDFLKSWIEGGKRGKDVVMVNDSVVELTSSNATMEHIFLRYREIGPVSLSLKTKKEPVLSADQHFNFDIVQYSEGSNTPQGGQTYQIKKGISGEDCLTSSTTLSGTIAVDKILSDSILVTGNILIPNGRTLKFERAIVMLTENVVIKVMPGGQLIINGSELLSACNGKKWKGIAVKGSPVFLSPLTITNSFITGSDSPVDLDQSKGILVSKTTLLGYDIGTAMVMNKMKDFQISENTFSNYATGIKTTNTSAADVRSGIEKNIFLHVKTAIDFTNDNHTKLDVKCNRFSYTDYAILSDQTLLKDQGVLGEGAGNEFISNSALPNNKLKHTSGNSPKYYYDPTYPITSGMNITTLSSTLDRTCYTYSFDTSSTVGSHMMNPLNPVQESIGKKVMDLYFVPNPSSGETTIYFSLGEEKQGELLVTDVYGKIVDRIKVNAESTKVEVNYSEYANGIYLISLTNSKGEVINKKMIISK